MATCLWRGRVLVAAIGLAALLAGASPSAADAPEEGRARLTASFSLARPAFTLPLRADIIAAPWEPEVRLVDDYAEATYGEKWNFDDGGIARIAEFGTGLLDPRVEDGKLKFTTGAEDARFYWGDADGKFSKHRQEKFRWNHPFWSIGVLCLRIRQSLPESQWKVALGGWTELGSFDTHTEQQFTLRGTDWQTVQVWLGRRGERFSSWLSIQTDTPGNQVEIDEVRVVRESEHAYFRTQFMLPSAPVFGGIWYVAQPQYSIYVNGQKIHSWHGNGCGWWPAWIDITRYLKVGANSLAFDRELLDWMGRENFLVVGGVVRCVDGRIVRIATTDRWRVERAPAKGWTEPGFDDSGWEQARSYGDASKAHFPPTHPGQTGSDIEEMWRGCLDAGCQVIPPRHLGAMELAFPHRPDPVFRWDEPVVIRITAPRRRFDRRRYTVSYRLFDPETRRLVRSGRVPEQASSRRSQRWQFQKARLKPGVYAAYFDLNLGNQVEETAFLELAVCGPLGGPKIRGTSIEEGLRLTPVDRIDCGDPNDAHDRVYGEGAWPDPGLPQPQIVDDPVGGRVLELSRPFQWAGYRLRFDDPTKPYLVRVTYPDSHPQVLGLRIDQPGWGSGYECITGCGAYTGRETPPSQALHHFSTLTWPRDREATLCLLNYNSPLPVRVKSVDIFRVDNELPQMEIRNAAPGRTFGYVTERGPVVLPTFLQDPFEPWLFHAMENCPTTATLYYWWKAGQNLIRWLKFTGQNAWAYNAHMYGQTYYPTELADRYEKSSYAYPLPLLAKMFEVNGLSLFTATEFLTARPVWERDVYTDDEAAEGGDTLKAVSSEGRQQVHFAGAGSNYQHPVVEDAIVTMVRDLCASLAAYPAYKGVHLSCGGYFGPSVFKLHRQMDLLKNSYDGTSIRRFEAFSGMKVPDFGRTREKFTRRREWLEKNALTQWIAWRCAAVTDLIRRCVAAATAVRKDLLVVCDWGDWSYGHARIKQWADGRLYHAVAAEAGVDPPALRQIPGALFGQVLEQAGEWESAADHVLQGAFDAALQSVETRGEAGAGTASLFLHHPFSETGLSIARRRDWPWTSLPSCTYSPRPVGADYLANYNRALTAGVPQMLWHGYCDVQHYSGGEQDLQMVARAFRSIPPGEFREPTPALPTKNVLVRVNTDGQSFLLINPAWWEVRCRLTLMSRAMSDLGLPDSEPRKARNAQTLPAVIWLNSGEKMAGPRIEVRLGPFAVESFRLEAATSLGAAMGEVEDPRAGETMRDAVARLMSYREDLERQGVSLADVHGRHLVAAVERLRRWVEDADYGRAYSLMHDIEYCRAVGWAREQLRTP